jgi:hypothetical protein
VKESKETRLVWLTMLMLKDSDGIVQSSMVGLADCAKVTEEECQEAVRVLTSPDPDSSSSAEEGRRAISVPGGWKIVNSDLYRFSTEAKREFWRQQKEEQRASESSKVKKPRRRRIIATGSGPTKGESRAVKAMNGGNTDLSDAIAAGEA